MILLVAGREIGNPSEILIDHLIEKFWNPTGLQSMIFLQFSNSCQELIRRLIKHGSTFQTDMLPIKCRMKIQRNLARQQCSIPNRFFNTRRASVADFPSIMIFIYHVRKKKPCLYSMGDHLVEVSAPTLHYWIYIFRIVTKCSHAPWTGWTACF